MSPTQRSLKHLRDAGFTCQVVERWNVFAKVRQDLYGWVDIHCLSKDGFLGVQTTTKANMGARLQKARGNPALILWLVAGGHLECHGWVKRKGHWVVDVKRLSLDDLISSSA